MAASKNDHGHGIRFSRFTSDSGILTKTLALGPDGELVKGTAANLFAGQVENIHLDSFDDFAQVLMGLRHSQALAYGVSLRGNGTILSEALWDARGQPEGVLMRNRDHFDWPDGGGVLMLDYDPVKENPSLPRQELLDSIYRTVPELLEAGLWWWQSASSCIYDSRTGEEVAGVRGQRIYIWVADARDIPRASKALEARLWLNGYGRFDVSKSGRKLARTIVDGSVWQPERLDFAAGAKCAAPLEQRREAPLRLGGGFPLDTRAILDLTDDELDRVEKKKSAARAAVEERAAILRKAYIEKNAKMLQGKNGIDEKTATEIGRVAVEEGRLMGDFQLLSTDGKQVSVGQILDDRNAWHGTRFHDPLEPDYPDDRIAYINLFSGGKPYLWSHAHGGRKYELCRTVATIDISPGGTAEATDKTLEVMRLEGTFYERVGAVVTVTERVEVQTLGVYALKQKAERSIRYQRFDGRKERWKPVDCPDEVARRVLDMKGNTGLLPLGGVVQYPTMTAVGRLLDKPGYDDETGLLLLNPLGRVWPTVPRRPSEQQVISALRRLWAPVAQFPYANETSRGIALAAMLTAVVRRSLPTSPAFMFAAPSAGSGKTLLASCVVELAGRTAPMSLPDSDAEVGKLLVSLLRKSPGAIFFDNVVGTVDSKALNVVLTGPMYDGRILGLSETTGSLPTNVLVVLTGNNARPVGDSCRRILVSTIDPKVESPYLREFLFDPLTRIRTEKMDLVVAALTVLSGWVASGGARPGKGSFASFEDWDHLIRQAVIWVGLLESRTLGNEALGFGDPIADVSSQYAADDETEALGDLLETWAAVQDGSGFKSGELYKALDGARRGEHGAQVELAALGLALFEIIPKAQSAKGVSSWLKSVRGRVVRGLRIDGRADKAANNTSWYVQRI